MRYLDPKNDLIFKKVFGNHPDLLKSLLNALLPLPEGSEIDSFEYLPAELVPSLYLQKNTIVDVRCKDTSGRQFVVEMQMEWTTAFMQRVLFNASKAYVRQLGRREAYATLQPVYSLNFVNDIFLPKLKDDYRHDYAIVHEKYSDQRIEGLHFTFIELPKFKPSTMCEKRMAVLWLRFLTEVDNFSDEVPAELKADPCIEKALEEVAETAFTEAELMAYDKMWDEIRTERTLFLGKFDDGLKQGIEQGMQRGREEGRKSERLANARSLLTEGLSVDIISKALHLSPEELDALKG